MPGAHSRIEPASAGESPTFDDESQLKAHLQRQFEEDVARIFDESIHYDLEVVCGRLKILTHSCILKTRTHKFYHKLNNILHVNIGRKTFDELNSFISDVYTECDIQHQEKEIITYIKDNINLVQSVEKTLRSSNNDPVDSDIFYTPNCTVSPCAEKGIQNIITSSPSTELTKEYYALVPINGNLLDKELIEQDALSNAFLSIIKTQVDDKLDNKVTQHNKPTSLSLSSHSSKTVIHSNTCDILPNSCVKDDITKIEINNDTYVNKSASQDQSKLNNSKSSTLDIIFKESNTCETTALKLAESTYSPDSLITDEPSSSSDYLSPAYTCSPGPVSISCLPRLNVGDNITKMENVFTVSDSGLDNTDLTENLNSQKDVTLADVSLTESTFYDLATDETNHSTESTHSSLVDKKELIKIKPTDFPQNASLSGTSKEMDANRQNTHRPVNFRDVMSGKSCKDEKQRQNEEIVTLESSSLSSETGSWESVFPPKLAVNNNNSEKDVKCEYVHSDNFYLKQIKEKDVQTADSDNALFKSAVCESYVQTNIKPTACFIGATSLVEKDDNALSVQKLPADDPNVETLPAPSQPVPCSSAKLDISPNDWSESVDNEDSLEQADKDPNTLQKDLSPTIFEMTPVTEDSLCANTFEYNLGAEGDIIMPKTKFSNRISMDAEESVNSVVPVYISTPNNSIMSLKDSSYKQYESEDSEFDVASRDCETHDKLKTRKFCTPLSIISRKVEGQLTQYNVGHADQLPKRRIENIPIVSGAFQPEIENTHESNQVKVPKSSCAPTWIVDMSSESKSESSEYRTDAVSKKPTDKVCESLKKSSKSSTTVENFNKSRSSVDSDSSERSSHKFYIDLSSLPDPLPPDKTAEAGSINEKKNIFTMYIDLGEKSTLKEMPARLSTLNSKKSYNSETIKNNPKNIKLTKTPLSTLSTTSSHTLSAFEKIESLCNDPNISISEIIQIPEKCDPELQVNVIADIEVTKKDQCSRSLGDSPASLLDTTLTSIEETPNNVQPDNESADLFVKLSDLDKPVSKLSDLDNIVPKTLPSINIDEEKVWDVRMTRSIPDSSWVEKSFTCPSRSVDIISSFHSENALSLNRLFPHLKNEFSRSVPGSLSSRTRSPLRLANSSSTVEMEEQGSDMSEMSSVQSSICRSVIENSTTEETSQTSSFIGSCQSRLGQDLLRMFLEEIAPDVIVEVSGKRIKAHKCILSSRCQFFAGILSGGWVESAGNVIALPSFSYNVVHFAMCHIYSGLSVIPDTISILELATLADMLGLEGLKEAIMFTLKAKYCHHFHRPCPVCIAGVLECFPLSSAYGLDDLYRKCLKWITKYFTKVWPTKAFATLPSELLEKCCQQHIVHLTTENFVETVYGCGMTVTSLQNSRWAETVARLCRRVVKAGAHFAANRLVAVLRVMISLPPDAPTSAAQTLNNCLSAAIEWAPPEETCRAYAFLSDVARETKSQYHVKPDLITNNNQSHKMSGPNNLLAIHAVSWRIQCEDALVRAAPRVVDTQAFRDLPSELRKSLHGLGCFTYSGGMPVNSPAGHDKKNRGTCCNKATNAKTSKTSTSRSLDIDHVRASFVPYAPKPTAHVSSADILKSNKDLREGKKINLAKPPKIRTTKAQEERAKYNMFKKHQSQDRLNDKPAAIHFHSYETAKPRHLGLNICKENVKKISLTNKRLPKKVSSSESSPNSSPIHLRSSRLKTRQHCDVKPQAMSQDSLATSSRPHTAEPSTDSLSESQNSNKYATYTKSKHLTKRSLESMKLPRSHISQTTIAPNKMKTKIPVSLALNLKSRSDSKSSSESQKRTIQSATTSTAMSRSRAKPSEVKITGSLMNATKSSSAKMVPKIVKDPLRKKAAPNTKVLTKNTSKQEDDIRRVMERSDTFLKDEPTFGDKTTNMDIGQ